MRHSEGQSAPCCRDARIELVARTMAVAAHPNKWAGAEEHWEQFRADAEKWLAAWDEMTKAA